MKVWRYFTEIFEGTKSLAIGMGITFRYMVKPVVTVQYPWETLAMSPGYRGHTELVPDPETGEPKCVVCGMCQKACPSNCITVEGEKVEGQKGKKLTRYRLDFTRCSLCGSCVESCNFDALRFSREYNLAGPNREAFVFDLKKRLEEQRQP